MKQSKEPIPRFDISASARAGITIKIETTKTLGKVDVNDDHHHDVTIPHRDTHYLFLITYEGTGQALVDFNTYHIKKPIAALILPGQIHYVKNVKNFSGCALTFDPSLMPEAFKGILDYYFRQEFMLPHNKPLFDQLHTLCTYLQRAYEAPPTNYSAATMHALLHSLLGLLANHVEQYQLTGSNKHTRSHAIERLFKQLLQENYRHWKKPAHYAGAMNITISHLNDMIREVTGASVTWHIQEAIILEAKRLLYHTDLTAKEICFEIGLEDAVYFSRLFKKVTNLTPLAFRQQFRD